MIRANFDLKFPLQIDFQEDNLEAKQQENFQFTNHIWSFKFLS
jgi:hypothetical protein